jgi:putative tricarboxylic transport membrane protein
MQEAPQTNWFKGSFAAAISLLTIYTGYTAAQMSVYSALGPGPGFFPLVLSIILAVLTLLWTLAAVAEDEMPIALDRQSYRKIVAIVIAILLSIVVMRHLGFLITSCFVMSFITFETGSHRVLTAAAFGVASSLAFYLLFHSVLGLNLPTSDLALLQSLGV